MTSVGFRMFGNSHYFCSFILYHYELELFLLYFKGLRSLSHELTSFNKICYDFNFILKLDSGL